MFHSYNAKALRKSVTRYQALCMQNIVLVAEMGFWGGKRKGRGRVATCMLCMLCFVWLQTSFLDAFFPAAKSAFSRFEW